MEASLRDTWTGLGCRLLRLELNQEARRSLLCKQYCVFQWLFPSVTQFATNVERSRLSERRE